MPAPSQHLAGQSFLQLSAAVGTPYRLEFPVLVQVIFQRVPLELMFPTSILKEYGPRVNEIAGKWQSLWV